MAQETEKNITALEMFEELKKLRECLLFEWRRNNLNEAMRYLDKIIEKTDKYIEELQNLKNN